MIAGRNFVRFRRYAVVGLVSNALLYGAFLGLIYMGVPALVATGACYVAGVTASYIVNRSWSFETTSGHAHDLPRFLAAYGIGMVATLGIMSVLLWVFPPELAQILNIGLTAVVIYCCLVLLKFGDGGRHNHSP